MTNKNVLKKYILAMAVLLVAVGVSALPRSWEAPPPPQFQLLSNYGLARETLSSSVTASSFSSIHIFINSNAPFFVIQIQIKMLGPPPTSALLLTSVANSVTVTSSEFFTVPTVVPAGKTYGEVVSNVIFALPTFLVREPMGNPAIPGTANVSVVLTCAVTGCIASGSSLEFAVILTGPSTAIVSLSLFFT